MEQVKSPASQAPKSQPPHARQQEAIVNILRTANYLRTFCSPVFDVHDITAQQYNVLRILRGAEPDGLPTLEIASRMIESAPGITRLLERLEKKKLVSRCRRHDDKRCVDCRITPAGATLLALLDAPVRAAAGEAFHNVNKLELAQLVQALDHVRQSLRKKEES